MIVQFKIIFIQVHNQCTCGEFDEYIAVKTVGCLLTQPKIIFNTKGFVLVYNSLRDNCLTVKLEKGYAKITKYYNVKPNENSDKATEKDFVRVLQRRPEISDVLNIYLSILPKRLILNNFRYSKTHTVRAARCFNEIYSAIVFYVQ